MDNYPLGTVNDPYAPYNQTLEDALHFELTVKGVLYPVYSDECGRDCTIDNFRSSLDNVIDNLDTSESYTITEIQSEVW